MGLNYSILECSVPRHLVPFPSQNVEEINVSSSVIAKPNKYLLSLFLYSL